MKLKLDLQAFKQVESLVEEKFNEEQGSRGK